MAATHKNASDWRSGSNRNRIAILCEQGESKQATYRILSRQVGDGSLVFKRNPNRAAGETRRVALPISEQYVALRNEIGRVWAEMGRAQSADWDAEEIPADEPETEEEIPVEDEPEEDEPVEDEPVKPVAAGKQRVRDELRFFLTELRRIRTLCETRAESGSFIDEIGGMRPVEAAAKLIPAGIPAAALLHSMLVHWNPEIRRNDALVPDFDFKRLSLEIMEKREIDPTGKHPLFGYVLTLAEERQPVMLVGPAGTGKSFLVKQVSRYLGLEYGETPLSNGATRGDLLGRMTANPNQPFILSHFGEIYGNGGVFNFEEIDAADSGMLLVLNNALAGDEFFNSANGQKYARSENFIPMATANTFGKGANKEFTGRSKLDAATLDRWRMGRIWIPLDETLEEAKLFSRV